MSYCEVSYCEVSRFNIYSVVYNTSKNQFSMAEFSGFCLYQIEDVN